MVPNSSAPQTLSLEAFSTQVAQLLSDRRCEDVQLLHVRGLSHVCDYILIGTGTSDRQMRSVADEVSTFGKSNGYASFSSARDESDTWIIIDFVEIVVHLFEPRLREYYALEQLWHDATLVPWQEASRAHPGSPQDERKPTED